MRRTKAPSDEGAVSEADWGREKTRNSNVLLSLRPFGPPPSSEGGKALPRHSNETTNSKTNICIRRSLGKQLKM